MYFILLTLSTGVINKTNNKYEKCLYQARQMSHYYYLDGCLSCCHIVFCGIIISCVMILTSSVVDYWFESWFTYTKDYIIIISSSTKQAAKTS